MRGYNVVKWFVEICTYPYWFLNLNLCKYFNECVSRLSFQIRKIIYSVITRENEWRRKKRNGKWNANENCISYDELERVNEEEKKEILESEMLMKIIHLMITRENEWKWKRKEKWKEWNFNREIFRVEFCDHVWIQRCKIVRRNLYVSLLILEPKSM